MLDKMDKMDKKIDTKDKKIDRLIDIGMMANNKLDIILGISTTLFSNNV